MREIKFRAWHKTLKQLRRVSRIDFLKKEVYVLHPNGEERSKPWIFADIAIIQFTGLKDKNDIEIYEGDIVTSDKEDIIPSHDHSKYEEYTCGMIEYVLGGFNICESIVGRTQIEEYIIFDERAALEVIGNIHENPDLIQK